MSELIIPENFCEEIEKLPELQKIAWRWRVDWLSKAHSFQVLPKGDHWTVWLLLAGRGSGKTKCASNNIGWWAWIQPKTRGLVMAPTANDIRFTCFEGDSGLLNTIPHELIANYNKSTFELELKNGSHLRGISADSYERLRGPQFHYAWCFLGDTQIALPDGSSKAIKEITVGQYVLTRYGKRRVLAASMTNLAAKVVKIKTCTSELTGTLEHPILTKHGKWVSLGDIAAGDEVCMMLNGSSTPLAITPERLNLGKQSFYIARYMSFLMAGCQKIRMCIIKMATSLTMKLLILRQFRTESMREYIGSWHLNSIQNARHVTKSSNLIAQFQIKSLDFARAHVGINGAGSLLQLRKSAILRASLSSARPAWNFSLQDAKTPDAAQENVRYDTVISVEPLEKLHPVFNLTVEGEHEYVANGFVVHNCDELAAYEYLQQSWDMMMFGLRLGKLPRVIATTTPKPKELIWQLVKREGKDVIVDRASSYANLMNLAPTFKAQITQYEGTKLGRQEIHAEIIDPFEAGVIKKAWIQMWPHDKPLPSFDYIAYSLDTAFTEKSYEKDTYDRDPTACTVWGLFHNTTTQRKEILLLDCWDDYYGLPDLIDQVKKDMKNRYGTPPSVKIKAKDKYKTTEVGRNVDLIIIEDKGSGISLRQMLAREGIKSYPYNPGKADKLARLNAVSHFFYHKTVWLPESETRHGEFKSWTEELVKQICSYAGEDSIKHDDYVDSMTQSLIYFADKNWLSMTVPAPEPTVKKPRGGNPYAM